jgi:signal transduction histidine kinase
MVFGNSALLPADFRPNQESRKQQLLSKPTSLAREMCAVLFQQLRQVLHLLKRGSNKNRAALQPVSSLGFLFTSLEYEISRLGDELSSNHHAWLRILVIGRPRALDPHLLQQFSLVAQEALRNALRHSQAPVVEVELEYLPRKLRLVIRDNGSGIHPRVLSPRGSHSGLRTMQERAESIGAHLRIWSKPGGGTEVEITIGLPQPVPSEYAPGVTV